MVGFSISKFYPLFFARRKFTVNFSKSLLPNQFLGRHSAVVYNWRRHLILNTAVAPETLWAFCKLCEGGVRVEEPLDRPEARPSAAADDDTSRWNHSLVFLSCISLPVVPAYPWGDLIALSLHSYFFISHVYITAATPPSVSLNFLETGLLARRW